MLQSKKKIAIDTDLVCTRDLGINWYEYLVFNYGYYLSDEGYERFCKDVENNQVDYNIAKYFDLPSHIDPMEFWKQDDLYDNETLPEGCYNVVKHLWQAGFEIYFVSVTVPEHMRSKKDFLVRNFDFLDNINFVATDAKHCMDGCFAFIDDRMENINSIEDENTLRILFDTPYKQDVESTQGYKLAKSWQDVEDFICKKMEEE